MKENSNVNLWAPPMDTLIHALNMHSHVKKSTYNLTAITRKQNNPTKKGQRTRISRDDLDTATSRGLTITSPQKMQVKGIVTNHLVSSRKITAFRKAKALVGLWRSWDPVNC